MNVGYQFTWVITKHLFLNVKITTDFGNQCIELETIEGVKSFKISPAAQKSTRGAFGYETRFFYAGLTCNVIWKNFQYKGYDLDLATKQFRVFIGKRFNVLKRK